MWMKGLTDGDQDVSNLRKIATTVSKFRSELNDVSQTGEGDKSLRVDQEEF